MSSEHWMPIAPRLSRRKVKTPASDSTVYWLVIYGKEVDVLKVKLWSSKWSWRVRS